MAGSVHAVNWINMLQGSGWQVFLLPVYAARPLPTLQGARTVSSRGDVARLVPGEVGVVQPGTVPRWKARIQDRARGYRPWQPSWLNDRIASPGDLAEAIRLVRPDLVHSMEVQLAGYLCLEAKRRLGAAFPPWLLSNWGSDIYLFRKLRGHQDRLRAVASSIDFYLAECERDQAAIRDLGFCGVCFDPVPASGGVRLEAFGDLLAAPPPSRRRVILIKAYQGWAGRGLTALSAVRLAHTDLRDFSISITMANQAVGETAATIARETGLDIRCEAYLPSHADALARVAGARISVGVGISDGISTSLLEAMAFGGFPIQSDTACADEWVEDGRSGFIVSPHDTRQIADRLARAATDDALVDTAAAINRRTIERRWHVDRVRERVLSYYQSMVA
ncbi:MAG TPA: glycosyltransferase [Alphaproteobacteria bacterium]|nr:glycosyltransferase [Alphaproteobacteria bacterium]